MSSNTTNFILGLICGAVAQIITFMQLQGRFKYEWFANNQYIVLLLSLPASWLVMQSVTYFRDSFNEEIWPGRMLGFGIGAIVFQVMSQSMFSEPLTLKTILSLILGVGIILIQIWMK